MMCWRLLARLLGQEDSVDVGQNTAAGDGDSSEELVELLVVLDGQGDVAGDDTCLFVVAGGVSGELEDLGAEVLEDGGEVDGRTGSHAGGVLALAEVTSDTTDGELKPGLGRRGGGLLLTAASLSFSRHGCRVLSCKDDFVCEDAAFGCLQPRERGFTYRSAVCIPRPFFDDIAICEKTGALQMVCINVQINAQAPGG
ncbi:hypothetical protein THAOC_12889 [Thalassiosira oceanica]|uniref:Uncharacterized protein n=1 Tax=Thalassiosira oceanica TaxID=159749 RepID=K0T738_THAOC|nr:hypothetical protein THAOC_12889 [Thalassiosira oceanica]|eukprot:EJK66207.1 hypothetical protein THAOC_12889 [Thalassiosira oceanica]